MLIREENIYQSPVAILMNVDVEGVLCASPGNERVEEEGGNGGFI